MFTGIVQGTAELVAIDSLPNFRTHVIRMPSPAWGEGLALGASVAHNGCCLTVTRVEGDLVSFDLMQETLRLTNLGQLVVGDKVNVERAARFGDEIGGHAMSGHIMGTAEVTSVIDTPNNRQVWYRLDPALMKYVLTKGYIGIDGISLTVGIGQRRQDQFALQGVGLRQLDGVGLHRRGVDLGDGVGLPVRHVPQAGAPVSQVKTHAHGRRESPQPRRAQQQGRGRAPLAGPLADVHA